MTVRALRKFTPCCSAFGSIVHSFQKHSKPVESSSAELSLHSKNDDFDRCGGAFRDSGAFSSVGASSELQEWLRVHFNITNPTSAQLYILQAICSSARSDVLIKNDTGSGKTLAVLVALLIRLDRELSLVRPVSRRVIESALSYSSEKTTQSESASQLADKPEKGKTIAFVMVPTRELAAQVSDWLRALNPILASSPSYLQCIISGGNLDMEEQAKLLRVAPPAILVGTPPRLLELFDRDVIDVSGLQFLFIDEVDRLLEPIGRYATIKKKFNRKVHPLAAEVLMDKFIIKREGDVSAHKKMRSKSGNHPRLQIICCSATLNSPTRLDLIKRKSWVSRSAVLLDLSEHHSPAKSLSHLAYLVNVGESDGALHLVNLNGQESEGGSRDDSPNMDGTGSPMSIHKAIAQVIQEHEIERSICFVKPTASTLDFVSKLGDEGVSACRISDYLLSKGKVEGEHAPQVIVATEFEARGLDIPELTHVLIVGFPSSPASYIHMAGRAGRFGRKGSVISFIVNPQTLLSSKDDADDVAVENEKKNLYRKYDDADEKGHYTTQSVATKIRFYVSPSPGASRS